MTRRNGEKTDADTGRAEAPGSAFAGAARFVGRHPVGVLQAIVFALIAVVVLQNLEDTRIDVLFWSVPAVPKVVLILLAMLVGAAAWEVARRALRRR